MCRHDVYTVGGGRTAGPPSGDDRQWGGPQTTATKVGVTDRVRRRRRRSRRTPPAPAIRSPSRSLTSLPRARSSLYHTAVEKYVVYHRSVCSTPSVARHCVLAVLVQKKIILNKKFKILAKKKNHTQDLSVTRLCTRIRMRVPLVLSANNTYPSAAAAARIRAMTASLRPADDRL